MIYNKHSLNIKKIWRNNRKIILLQITNTPFSSIKMHYILLVAFPHIIIVCVTVFDTILFIIFIIWWFIGWYLLLDKINLIFIFIFNTIIIIVLHTFASNITNFILQHAPNLSPIIFIDNTFALYNLIDIRFINKNNPAITKYSLLHMI